MMWIGIGIGAVAVVLIGGSWLAYIIVKSMEDE